MEICGYTVTERLNNSAYTLVYRAVQKNSGKSVVLKLPKSIYPTPDALIKIRHEYDTCSLFQHNKIVPVLGLEEHEHKLVLIREDFDAVPLSFIKKTGSQDLLWFLDIAIQLSDGLREVHHKKVIHKNFCPDNILYRPITGRIKLVDFSIATRAEEEHPYLSENFSLEGSLPYISPEQTGRLDMPLDYRTDFYSLGVTLYQLLTGILPFETDDPVELLHSHIAKTPTAPHEHDPAIPPTVSNIILKLLEKSADKRYQSCNGLIPDLMKCMIELKDQQAIVDFSIGRKDVSKRFSIPQKLYGRTEELEKILEACRDTSTDRKKITLIRGCSGIGKTTLTQEALKILKTRDTTIINCKIDQDSSNLPYEPIIKGFNEILQEILITDDTTIEEWKITMLNSIGDQAQVITAIIPDLELIIGPQIPAPELPPTESKIRFTRLFLRFIAGCSSQTGMLVFFLDDLRWIDQESIELLGTIAQDPSISCIFIGTYRDDDPDEPERPHSPLVLFEEDGFDISTIYLEPLSPENISSLLSESLFSPFESVKALTDICLKKTDGNPFFLKELLKELDSSGHLTFNTTNGRWDLDIKAIFERPVMHNVGATLSQRLAGFSHTTQNILKIAACIGNAFNLSTLAALNRKSRQQTLHDLAETIREGLVLQIKPQPDEEHHPQQIVQPEEFFQFAHDHIRNAAYDLIPENDQHHFHLQLGRLLMQTLPPDIKDQQIFNIVSHCNRGIDLLITQREKLNLAVLNLKAAHKAKNAGAYHSYYTFAKTSLRLLPEDIWKSDYSLALQVNTKVAESASLCGLLEEMEDFFQIIIKKSRTLLDKTKVYHIKIRACIATNRLPEATRSGLEILAEMGIIFPKNPGKFSILKAIVTTKIILSGKTTEYLLNLPEITDPFQKSRMDFLHEIETPAYYTNPALLPFLGLTAIKLSLKHGNSINSAIIGYPTYGYLLSSFFPGEIENGYNFGLLALKIREKLDSDGSPRPLYLFNNLIAHWKNHINTTLPQFLAAYRLGLNCGDLETAANCACSYSCRLLFLGYNLEETEKELSFYHREVDKFDQKIPLHRLSIFQQATTNLLHHNDDHIDITGRFYDSEKMVPLHHDSKDYTTLCIYHMMTMIHAYLFDNFELAEKHGRECAKLITHVMSSIYVPLFHFYYTLTILEIGQSHFDLKNSYRLKSVNSSIKKMKQWASFSPDNFEHKYLLMKAELNRSLGKRGKAADLYDESIKSARKSGYLREEALGLERAAHFYFKQGRSHLAKPYLTESLHCYRKWGAQAKIYHIENTIQKLIQDPPPPSNNPFFAQKETHSLLSYDDNAPWFDVMSVIKTSRIFAGEVVLGDLLKILITILLENAGGQTAFLLLKINSDWIVKAKATIDDSQGTLLDAPPIVFRHQMSQAIINYVGRSLETIVLNDACSKGKFINDNYILEHKPKSILCMPILHQREAIGILYLENNLTQGAFQPDRLEILNLIASQAAISIINSLLYEELEGTVKKLNKEVGKRKETQIQLMHAGKLSALGRISASIAHEFGNPLIGIKYLLDDLGNRIDLSPEDKKLVNIGLEECERMKDLINDLHNLHRPSTGKRKLFNLNDAAHNILLFQRKNLKNSRIVVETDLDPNLPSIRAVEDQITQAVVSLTINAADSMEEKGGQLLIKTSHDIDHVIIEVSDTGCGIVPELQEHIFEPFFSTKDAVEGTGLGLAIAYSIITSHNGEITFSSTPGEGSTFKIELPCPNDYDD